jgi:hypothetical protein
MISQAATRCAQLAEKEGIEETTRQGYLDLQLRFVRALDENIQLQMEVSGAAKSKSMNQTAPASKPFLPGAQISPIQILVQGGNVTEKKVEEPCKTSPA